MKIVVIGGTGLIGSKLVAGLQTAGHKVVVGSPNTGVNTITGEGLGAALAGADVLVDVANSPSFADQAVMDFFTTSSRNLLVAAAKVGIKHYVALSVVGTQRLQASGYFRAKQAQEDLIKASGLPFTIVHSTQFFEFAGAIVQSAAEGATVRLSPAMIQPISSDDVADAMFDVTVGEPANGIVEIAGPEKFRMAMFIRHYLGAKNDAREVKADPDALYFGARLDDDTLVPAATATPRLGKASFKSWVMAQATT